MYIDKLIRKEVITLIISVIMLVVIFIGVTFAKFLSVDNGEETVIEFGDLKINFCNDSTCDSTYSNIGQVIGTKVVDGVSMPASIYPFINDGTYSNENPYIFKVENTGTLDSTVKIRLKEDASFTPTGDYSDYARLTSKYANHLKVAIRKRVLYKDTGYQLGDVNMDGIVNYDDSTLVMKYWASNGNITDTFNPELADVNGDGTIDTDDAGDIIREIIASVHTSGLEPYYIYTYTDLEDGVIFKDDIIKSGESATYFLWLWLDSTTPNDAQKTFFVGNIDVDGEYSLEPPKPVDFATDSWETIVNAVRSNNTSKYNVGDTKEVELDGYGTHTLRIANTSTPSECSTSGFSQSACGFVLEFADIITTHGMNNSDKNAGGWPASSMYTFVNTDIYNAIPEELKNGIIDTMTVSENIRNEYSDFTSTDKLYLLAATDIYVNVNNNNDLARTLDYYEAQGVTSVHNPSGAIKKNGTTASAWWLRDACRTLTGNFILADSTGSYSSHDANLTAGVSPAFRIG